MHFATVIAITFAGVGVFGAGWWAGAASAPPGGAPSHDGELARQLAELRAEVSALRALDRDADVPSPPSPHLVRSDTGPDHAQIEEVSRKVDALVGSMEAVRAALSSLATGTEARGTETAIPKNIAAVIAAREGEKADRVASRLAHFCWTRLQVYRAYGLPDSVSSSGIQIYWEYSPGANEEGVTFIFDDGLVSEVNLSR